MNKIIIWIVALVLFGVFLSLYFVPTQEDLALIDVQLERPTKAIEYFQGQYDKGNHSPDVVIALSNLYEKEGQLNNAIAILEAYLKEHPQDYSGLRRLADLYQNNLQTTQYFQTIERMHQLKKDPKVLEVLVEENQHRNARGPLKAILEELVATGKADSSYYRTLSYYYAEDKEYEKAKNVLGSMMKQFQDKVIIDDILFELWLAKQIDMTTGKANTNLEEEVNLLADYLIQKNNLQITHSALSTVKVTYPEMLPMLIKRLAPLLKQYPSLVGAVLQMQWENPTDRKALFKEILAKYKEHPDDVILQNLVFSIYLENNDDAALFEFIKITSAKKFENRNIISLAVEAITQQNAPLAKALQASLGDEYLKEHSVINVSLAIGAKEKEARKGLDNLLKEKTLTQSDYYNLLKVSSAAKYDREVAELGAHLSPFIGMEDYQLVDIASAYIRIKRAQVLYDTILTNLPKIGENKADVALVVLDASLNRPERVIQWLNSDKKVPSYVLNDLFGIALENKQYELARLVAKRQKREFPSAKSSANYAMALVFGGDPTEGVNRLRRLHEKHPKDPNIVRNYFTALSFIARKNSAYRDDLLNLMIAIQSQHKRLPAEYQSDFAYNYLEVINDYPMAEKYFLKASKGKSVQSEEVKTMMYLWGPRPTGKQIAWIERHAAKSNDEDFGYWLENLNFVQRYCTSIQAYQSRPGVGLNKRATFAYMYALANTEQKHLLRDAIARALILDLSRKDLEDLAGLAEEAEYLEGRRIIWEWIAVEHPEDPIAWQRLGKAAFDQNDFDAAGCYLNRFFNLVCPCEQYAIDWSCPDVLYPPQEGFACYPPDCVTNADFYESLYQYGEVKRQQRCFKESLDFFLLAFNRINEAERPTVQMLEIKAFILTRLNFTYGAALKAMNEAYWMSARDPEVAATYVNMMMDAGRLRLAREFLDTILGCCCQPCLEGVCE